MTNPLLQNFRRPVLYVELSDTTEALDPSANGEYPVFAMTLIDEITAKTPDALMSGQAVVDVIRSCIPAIKDPWKASNITIDKALVAIKIASQGGEVEISSECPNCKTQTSYDVNLSMSLRQIDGSKFDQVYEFFGMKFKFKPINYTQVTDAQKMTFELNRAMLKINLIEDINEKKEVLNKELRVFSKYTMKITAQSIEYIETDGVKVESSEFIEEYLANIAKQDYEEIRNFVDSLRESAKVKPLKLKCPECEHEYQQEYQLDFSDFFG